MVWGGDAYCIVCMYALKTHALVPCGHACVCSESCELPMSKSKACPYCSQPGDTPVRVFDVQARITVRVRVSFVRPVPAPEANAESR